MNPIAAFCCLGMKIKALGELINREVLVPFANGVLWLWDGLKEFGKMVYEAVIKPAVDFIKSVANSVAEFWWFVWWEGLAVALIGFLGLPIFWPVGLPAVARELQRLKTKMKKKE